ncbi:DUF6326 family protein [Paractinoplanes brasiliensis]|uniref:Integral membrane protein n=1 Tax=Paractinoplanes brasiliensis TaxID=52695 RepID=A0A4R6JL97_9ACTN|nr:DUF6326 family protein [Actinoplanes brasiliensis]TDO36547.1 hypothetical protein C8E87_0123 [Actinoplanes brasiliensis]GID32486.1 hypothetical protein Abr02nite_74690 [Actinoplanes brasiliensis]
MKGQLRDLAVDVKVVLGGLWATTLLVFAYVDLFGFYRADLVRGVLAGEVGGFVVDQVFLVLTTLYVAVASLMVAVSLLAPARFNRIANIVVSLFYAVTAGVSLAGETWAYYIVGISIQMALLLLITRVAWTWPRNT